MTASSRLQAPLPWQMFLLCWIAGLCSAAWPLPSLCTALCLILADARLRPALPAGSPDFRRGCARLCCCAALLLAGFCTARPMLIPPPEPEWLSAASDASGRPRALALRGTVADVRGLTDGRLRVLLRDVRPEAGGEPLPGLAAWTWQDPLLTPRPGQEIRLERPIRDVHAADNREPRRAPEDTRDAPWDNGQELRQRAGGVSWMIWSRADAGDPRVLHDPNGPEPTLRERLRASFERALLAGAADVAAWRKTHRAEALLPALVFGDRRHAGSATFDLFARASLAHSLALSGQHLLVAALAGRLVVALLVRLLPILCLIRPLMLWTAAASLPFAGFYVWASDSPLSLLRAGAMLLGFGLAVWIGRTPPPGAAGRASASLLPVTTWDALCLALLIITAIAPAAVFDVGLQLSALCVASLCLVHPLSALLPPLHPARTASGRHVPLRERLLRSGLRILLASLVIQICMLPVGILLFDNAGHWFWLNLLWLPVLGVVTMPLAFLGLLAAACGLPEAASFCLQGAALPCRALIAVLECLDAWGVLSAPALLKPHWTAIPAIPALIVAGTAALHRRKIPPAVVRLGVLGVILLCAGPALRGLDAWRMARSGEIRLDALDVGQGQALLISLPDGTRILVDGGGSASPRFDPGRRLAHPALADNHAPRLAAVVGSHPDVDHVGGLIFFLNHADVGMLLDNGRDGAGFLGERWKRVRETARKRGRERVLTAGDTLILGDPALGPALETLHPPADMDAAGDDNRASLVQRLTWRGRGLALLTGDMDAAGLRRLAAKGWDLSADVLVLPHHGSDGGLSPEFFRAVGPRLALAGCGRGNVYGHPGRKVRQWLHDAGIPLLDTGRRGRIRVTWPHAGAAPVVRTALPGGK